MARIASFHLVREHPGRQPLVMARLGFDRRRLADVDGLLFWRLLGTGRGDQTASSADLRRSALFAVWRDDAALDRFLAEHPIAHRHARAEEAWHVRLHGLGGHGRWRGVDVFDGLRPGSADGPVAVLTRADVRPTAWWSFLRAGGPAGAEARVAPGLRAVVGIGEAPIGRQGTFSIWESAQAARDFAASNPVHTAVVARTRAERWYGEELFAWFEPVASEGSWAGRDPLQIGL